MTARKNPMKTCYYIVTFLVIMTFIDICFKIVKIKDVSVLFNNLFSWIAVWRIAIFVAFCAFIFFYIRKSFIAWYVLFIPTLISLPLPFLMSLKIPTSKLTIIIIVFMWGCACIYLLERNKEYKQFLINSESE